MKSIVAKKEEEMIIDEREKSSLKRGRDDTSQIVDGVQELSLKKPLQHSPDKNIPKDKNIQKGFDLPLPTEIGSPCIVKVYGNDAEFKICDVVEFVGVLCKDFDKPRYKI